MHLHIRITRRVWLGGAAGAAAAMVLAMRGGSQSAPAAPPPAAGNGLHVNQAGFVPGAAKYCVASAAAANSFEIATAAGQVVHRGQFERRRGDFGEWGVATFSHLREPGDYLLRAAGAAPVPVKVHPAVYADAIGKCVGYFARQRCGPGKSGFNGPCHLDDGVRGDDGRRLDVVGGWHDACDLRKWTSATVYGLVGLHRLLDGPPVDGVEPARVIDEMRWGNEYFLKMQDRDGLLMSYCGGDDGNHFTDNVAGTKDDRRIHVEPGELPEQFQFIAAQAALVRHARRSDPNYARRCEAAARRGFEACTTRRSARAAASVSGAVIAAVAMHRAFGSDAFADACAASLRQLIALQVTPAQGGEVHGFFLAKPDEPQPYRDVMHGQLPLIALCDACEHLPDHPNQNAWRQALRAHCDHLEQMASRSPFGVVPFGLYSGSDPGGGRRVGSYWYRWFMKTRAETKTADWWVGINANLASAAIGLCRAGRLLGERRLVDLAQRQLDWILGVNPFGASTITGVGRNQPRLFVTGAFKPPTPLIDGGVVNGIGGTELDEPDLRPGSYHTCEYWTPMVAYALWLMSELQRPEKLG